MSPADVILLLDWLDAKKDVVEIILALDRLAASRQKNRSRSPFSLAKAKRHLGRPVVGGLPLPAMPETPVSEGAQQASHPLDPLVEWIREDAASHAEAEERLLQLAAALEALPASEPEVLTKSAICLIRSFHQFIWDGLDSPVREGYIRGAVASLRKAGDAVDDAALLRAAEESARAKLRDRYPVLNAATILDLMKYAGNK
jgi:hypothetical protein